MRSRQIWVHALSLTLAATVAACGGGSSDAAKPAAGESAPAGATAGAAGGQKIDPATTGDLKGVISLNGPAPENAPIKMNADPMCLRQAKGPQFQETYKVAADGKSLGNVFVYVKDGLGNYVYDQPNGAVTFNQEGCHYIPHVFGIRVGQTLEIVNSDPTLHNIHGMPKENQEFNQGQPIQGMKTTHVFTKKEVLVPFKCDVHGWMNAFVGVMDHPFFAVSDADGKFEIKGLPAGTYTIEAVHERLGAVTQTVTIAAKDAKELNFTMDVSKAAATN